MNGFWKNWKALGLVGSIFVSGLLGGCAKQGDGSIEIVNVSYDPTRELYEAYNPLFEKFYKEKTGQDVVVTQSHGGSGKQALEVANGLPADVVTLALEGDVDVVAKAGLIEPGYVDEFEGKSSPYTSAIVFLVRAGNPKKIRDWNDLTRQDVAIVTPAGKWADRVQELHIKCIHILIELIERELDPQNYE